MSQGPSCCARIQGIYQRTLGSSQKATVAMTGALKRYNDYNTLKQKVNLTLQINKKLTITQ